MIADNLASALEQTELLSPRMRQLVELIGVSAAVLIVRARKGRRFYVPNKLEPDHWLTRLIGAEAASKLVQ